MLRQPCSSFRDAAPRHSVRVARDLSLLPVRAAVRGEAPPLRALHCHSVRERANANGMTIDGPRTMDTADWMPSGDRRRLRARPDLPVCGMRGRWVPPMHDPSTVGQAPANQRQATRSLHWSRCCARFCEDKRGASWRVSLAQQMAAWHGTASPSTVIHPVQAKISSGQQRFEREPVASRW